MLLFTLIVPASAETTIPLRRKDPCPEPYYTEIAQMMIDYGSCTYRYGEGDSRCVLLREEQIKRACEIAANGYCYSCDPNYCSKYGIRCPQSGTSSGTTSSPPESDDSWIVVVGLGAAVLIGGGIVGAKVLGQKKPAEEPVSPPRQVPPPRPVPPQQKPPVAKEKPEEKKKEEEKTTYILSLSTDHLKVNPREPGTFSAVAYKKTGNNPPERVYDAKVEAVAPLGLKGVSFTSTQGQGELDGKVEVTGVPSQTSFSIMVSASGGGSQTSAKIQVDVSQDYQIAFD